MLHPNRNKPIADLLGRAVTSTLAAFEAGDTLTGAAIKTASAMKLKPEQIHRFCQLINRANVNDVRLRSDNLASKLASAEVIDPQEVIRCCYGVDDTSEHKTAASPYTLAEQILASSSVPATAKHAAAPPSRPPSAQPRAASTTAGLYHGLGPEAIVREERQLIAKMARCQAQLGRELSHLQYLYKLTGQKLARLEPADQAELADQARFYFEERNPEVLVTLHHVIDQSLSEPAQLKLAAVPEPPESWHPHLFDKANFVRSIEQLDKTARAFQESLRSVSAQYGEAQARLEFLQAKTADGQVDNSRIVVGGSPLDEDLAEIKTAADKHAAGLVSSFMGSMAGAKSTAARPAATGAAGPSDVDKFTLQLRQPQHEAALAAIRTRTALQDVINNDSVIASYDPNQVLSYFNDLAQYAPRATESSAVLRSALRQMLQNHASIFDLQQVRQVERQPIRF